MRTAFEIGRRAIMAQQRGMDVTSNNIANVNTPGYSRQEASLVEADPMYTPKSTIGMGVFADKVRSYREQFLDKEMRGALSRKAGHETDANMIQRVQTALAEPTDFGIDSAMDKFFGAIEDLNTKPDDISRRETFLAQAQNLADTFNSVGERLADLRVQTYQSLETDVEQVNRLVSDIAEMNQRIVSSRSQDGEASGTYIDKQTKLLEDLSKYGAVQINRDTNGVADVTMNGTTMVSSSNASTLSLEQTIDSTTGEITASFNITDSRGNVLGSYKPQEGVLATELKHFNVTLDDKDSSTGYSLVKKVNSLANAFVTQVNTIANAGYGLDDATATPPGRNIFEPAPSGGEITARSIRLSADVKGKPRDLPVASASNAPGDNEIFKQLGQLVNSETFVDGETARAFYGKQLTTVANMGATATDGKNVAEILENQLTSQRESIIGVNLDEEAINLIKFQRAFEAAARVVNTTAEMLTTVVNLGR